jgi:hypothetical protein
VSLGVRPVRDLTGVHPVPHAWWQELMRTAVLAGGLVGALQQQMARRRRPGEGVLDVSPSVRRVSVT